MTHDGNGGLELHVAHGRRMWTFVAPRSPLLGNDGDCDVTIQDGQVPPWRVQLRWEEDGWRLVDLGETRSSWIQGNADASPRVLPGEHLRVHLGAPEGPTVLLGCERAGERPARRVITIGRSPSCDIRVDDPLVSRRHASVELSEQAVLSDRDSYNGTYLNGRRIRAPELLEVGDVVGIGGSLLSFTGTGLSRVARRPSLSARHLSVTTAAGAQLLDDVSITLHAGQVLAVIGPSGAGKSTLLGALTGLRPATEGRVTWNGRDLYHEYESLRLLIGLVPQEDILHRQLTVRRGLRFAADLRLPPDTTPAERDERIAEVLEEVELLDQFNQRIDSLSGGQRKRTSIALELLTAPQLLFLDEPTSGLDAGLDRRVMERLRALADAGRVVVVVTHSVLALDRCDRVLLLATGGRVAFFGPPEELLGFFGVADYPSVFLAIEDPSWVETYATSTLRHANLGRTALVERPVFESDAPPPTASVPTRLRQFWTLVRRNAAVIAADRGLLVLMVAMPLVLAAMSRALPGDHGLSVDAGRVALDEAQQRLLVLVVGAALMGTAMSVREVVAERPIFRREHAVGLSVGAYLGSKVAVLGTVVAAQAAVLSVLSLVGLPGPDDPLVFPSGFVEVTVPIVLLAVTMSVAGLMVSAVVKSSDQAMPALVALVMAQLVFCGALFPLEGREVLEQVSWIFPGRFAFAATAATVQLQGPRMPEPDPFWDHSAAQWLVDMGLLGLQALALVGLGMWMLSRSVRRSHA